MDSLICPVCFQALSLSDNKKSMCCQNKHLFDISKQGYLNLLLSHKKKSKQPGDTIEMVKARTLFLNQGYYTPLAERLTALINDNLPEVEDTLRYCDIACGEGYYTQLIHQCASEKQRCISTGFDISTPAIKAAAKRDNSIQWLIASANNIPLLAHSQNLLTCLFCRVDFAAAARIADDNALFIVAETGTNHLIELREQLYDDVFEQKNKHLTTDEAPFAHIKTDSFIYQTEIHSSEDIQNLLAMTPHFWRVKPEKKKALEAMSKISLTLDINLHLFKKSVSLTAASQ